MPSVEQLKQQLARTLKARKYDAALNALSLLAQEEPNDPSWPRRAARLLHARADTQGELAALRRALEIQVDRGLVLDAIASCKAILAIVPGDLRTTETLDLLYFDGPPSTGLAGRDEDDPSETKDAPLDSLLLTEVVPGARQVQLGDAAPGHINEIPVDSGHGSVAEEVVDLRLEQWRGEGDSESGLRVPGAARAPSSPTPAASSSTPVRQRGRPAGNERGASLRSELANIPLFGDLDPGSLHTLIRKVRVVTLAAGEVLFRQGDAANSLYIIVAGAVVPIAEGERRHKLAVLERGEFFGEIGLLTKQPRNATIEALVETKLLAIDRRVLWHLIQRQPSVAKSLLRFLRARMIDRQIRTNLFFSAFAHAKRETVARLFRILEVKPGTRVVEQGHAAEGLFVVLSGSLALIDRAHDKEIGSLALGDVFGGQSLLEGQPARSDVVARDKCWLLVLGEGRFRRIVDANPRLVRIVRRLTSEGFAKVERPSVSAL